MKRVSFLIVLFGALLYGALVLAADGGSSTSAWVGGAWTSRTAYLCDGVVDADDDGTGSDICTTFDFMDHGGIPDIAIIWVSKDAGCDAAYSSDINTFEEASTNEHDLVVLNATTSAAIAEGPKMGRYLKAENTTLDNCTEYDITVTMRSRRGWARLWGG